MLKEQVLTEWNSLKETIRGHQQYSWGKLLTNLGLRIVAPHLDLELITREIKTKLNKSDKDQEEIHSLREVNEKQWNWFDTIRKEANRKEMILNRILYTGNKITDLESKLESAEEETERWQSRFNTLKSMINNLGNEFGPTIEEVP